MKKFCVAISYFEEQFQILRSNFLPDMHSSFLNVGSNHRIAQHLKHIAKQIPPPPQKKTQEKKNHLSDILWSNLFFICLFIKIKDRMKFLERISYFFVPGMQVKNRFELALKFLLVLSIDPCASRAFNLHFTIPWSASMSSQEHSGSVFSGPRIFRTQNICIKNTPHMVREYPE